MINSYDVNALNTIPPGHLQTITGNCVWVCGCVAFCVLRMCVYVCVVCGCLCLFVYKGVVSFVFVSGHVHVCLEMCCVVCVHMVAHINSA